MILTEKPDSRPADGSEGNELPMAVDSSQPREGFRQIGGS
jgi:hypothetical protein